MGKAVNAVTSLLFCCLILCGGLSGQTPTEAATRELKKRGQYDSLMEAVKAVRNDNGKTVETQTADDAVGQSARLIGSDGASSDNFGISVAVDGDTAIIGSYIDDIGANVDQGSAYVFVRNGSTWTEQAKLVGFDGAAGDNFGFSVAINGNTAVIGAYAKTVGPNTSQGAAYVFVRSGTTWTQQAQLLAVGGSAFDLFGVSVSISGETAVIGAWADDHFFTDQGSAYVFVRSGTTWAQQAQLLAQIPAASDFFGRSVSISGDTAVVGAPFDDDGFTDLGTAHVFVRSGTTWTYQATLQDPIGQINAFFGYSVAIDGETAVIGAYGQSVLPNNAQGSAIVFIRTGTTWSLQAQLIDANGRPQDFLGVSVAIDGDLVVAGAFGDDVGANSKQASAFLFSRTGTVWTQRQHLTASDGADTDRFGNCVAISGNTIIVGANTDDIGSNFDQGSAYAFRVLSTNWSQEAQKVAADGSTSDQFGNAVAISGDTAVVGAFLDDVGANTNQGSVYVFIRNGTAWSQQAQLTASDGAASDQFGFSVAIYGDTVVIGSYLNNVGANSTQGSAYVFVRSGTTWTEQAQLTASDGAASDRFGYSVAVSGNTAIVGSYLDNVGANSDQGSAYVFTRSGTTWSQQAQLIASDGGATDQFGQSVSLYGNTAVVGAAFADVGANTNQGEAYVYLRSGTTWAEQQILTASDAAAQDSFGYSVSISDEILIVGAFGDDIGANVNQGSTYVFTRGGTIWTEQQKLTAIGGAATDQFGISVSLDGDTAIIGANLDDIGANSNQGSVYIFERVGTFWSQTQQATATGGADGDQFGFSVAINGNKFIVGAPFSDASASVPFSPQATDQGAAFIFINDPLAPTAASVSISGRVMTANGNGVRNAIVQLTDPHGVTRRASTGSFGYYRFDDVEAGQTYVIGVASKRYVFSPRTISVSDELTGLDLIAE